MLEHICASVGVAARVSFGVVEQARRWASKTSWRLTFAVWSALLVLWGVVTVLIDRDALLLIRELVGEHGRSPIVVLAAVIIVPVLADAWRNGSRSKGLWRHRSLRRSASARWQSDAPAMTPRRFRAGARQAQSPLTWREKAIVEQGQLAYGTVHHHGELTSVQYDAPWGDVIASRPVAACSSRPREGSRAPLLFEPGANVGVAPSLVGLEFLVTPMSDTRRVLPLDTRSDDTRAHETNALSLPIMATLHPVERLSRYCAGDVGQLEFGDERLCLTPVSGEPTTVRLDRPFRVEASVFLLADGRTELNLRIASRTHSAYRAGDSEVIELKTELPQARVDRHLPETWQDACYLGTENFDALWSVLVSASDDATLMRSVSLASPG